MPVLIVVTRLRIRGSHHRKKFLKAAAQVIKQANKAAGNLGTGVFPDANDVYWTRTAWKDREAMMAFMTTEPHRATMANIDEWCDEATAVDWEQDTPHFPDWRAAFELLVRQGRAIPLARPSPDHEARAFPPPVPR
jgi:quinol monooxygenase YgiN